MRSIKAVLFDLDDTLWPIAPVILRAEAILFDWLKRHAPAVTQKYTIASLREHRLDLMARDPRYAFDLVALRHAALTDAFMRAGEDPDKVGAAMTVFSRQRNIVDLFDDVTPTLSKLHGRVLIGSVTNGASNLEEIGIAHYFHTSLAAHRFGQPKPAPGIFRAACDALGVAPSEAAYVGDDPSLDVEGAQKAGLHGIWLNRQNRVLPRAIRPDAICTTLHEVGDWLSERIVLASGPGAR